MVKKVKENKEPNKEIEKKVEESQIVDKLEAEKDESMAAQNKEEMTAFQLKERKKRIIFVGNLPINVTAKQIQKQFQACGKIEKIWFRSICITEDSKKPQRAKIIQKDFGNFKDSKNAYILYKEASSALQAKIKLNQVLFMEKLLRVDTVGDGLAE